MDFFTLVLKVGGISNIALVERKDKKIAFAAFNAIHDHPGTSLVAPLERDILFNTLEEIKKHSPDFIVFSFHWGNEYVTWPSPSQVELGHELIDKGVNIIIGHHPHVVQPIEKYHGGVIIYSLGNFLFDMLWSEMVRNGMKVNLMLHDDKSIDYEIVPFRIRSDYTQDYSITAPVLSILERAERKLGYLKSGLRNEYEKAYLKEYRKCRLKARFKMKYYLLMNAFNLSPKSKELVFRNIKIKSGFLWREN